MAISRVPGYSLLANLDRQGTDLGITSSGLYVTYWDVVNYRFGVNTSSPQQTLDVAGNILVSNGHINSSANLAFDTGSSSNWWRSTYSQSVVSVNLTGTLLTNAQPNITSLGTLGNLTVSGNLYANITGNISGTILTANQPYITNVGVLGNLTVSGNISATRFNGNVYGNLTGQVLTNAQPNITSVGILTTINVSGNILANNVLSSTLTGTLLTNSQPNINSLGTLTTLSVTGNITGNLVGNVTGTILTANQPYITNIGTLSNLTVSGNVSATNFVGNLLGLVITASQPLITSLGTLSNLNVTGNILANSVTAATVSGTLLTNSQPNITSLGTVSNLKTTGNTYLTGTTTVNGNLTVTDTFVVGTISANSITGGNLSLSGNVTGYVLQGNQPYITTLSNISVSNITIQGNTFAFAGNTSLNVVNASVLYQNNNKVLDASSNIVVTGDVTGYGTNANVYLGLPITGVAAGVYGSDGQTLQLTVDSKGRITAAANVVLTKIANISFSNTTISSPADITMSTTSGNITLDAGSAGLVKITGTDAVGIPYGDDSQRPVTPDVGYFRFNTQRQMIEYYNGSEWSSPTQGTISSQIISPDGAANTFALASNTTTSGVLVSINGTLQQPIYSYDIVNNNQIQFTETPLTTDVIEVRFISFAGVTVSALRFGQYSSVVLDSANVNITGNLQTSGFINPGANVLLPTLSTTTVDSFSLSRYRTVKYVVQAVRQSDVESQEVLVTHNGTTSNAVVYGTVRVGNSLGTISTTVSGGNVLVRYTALATNTYITTTKIYHPL